MKSVYKVSQDQSGITVATAEMPHMSSVALGIWVGVGGRYEPAPLCGVSHFIEHMLFKGTKRRNARQISQDVEGVGGYLNAFTTEESTCFYAKAARDQLEPVWDVLADMFLNSTFDSAELEKERNVIKEELAIYLDQPHHQVQELLNETLWPDQPLGRALTGTDKTLDSLSRANLIEYRNRNYVSKSTLITLAGKVEHRDTVKQIARWTSRFKQGKRPVFSPADAAQDTPRLR